MMVNVFEDAGGNTRWRLAQELRLAAATSAGRQFRGALLASADALFAEGAAQRAMTLVIGEELGDGAQATWVVCGYEQLELAEQLAQRLNSLAAAFGRSIGNDSLVGLEHGQRRELESHVRRLDRDAKVGRHGVRWYLSNSVLNPR